MDTRPETFTDMLIGSILISGTSFGVLWMGHNATNPMLWYTAMGARLIAFGWFLLFVRAVGRFGKRGLWLLLGGLPAMWVIVEAFTELFRCLFVGGCVP